jgi:hypothetical protein
MDSLRVLVEKKKKKKKKKREREIIKSIWFQQSETAEGRECVAPRRRRAEALKMR